MEIEDASNGPLARAVEIREAVSAGLGSYNASQRPDPSAAPVVLAVSSASGELIGGLVGRTAYGWLRVDWIWVLEAARGVGIGARLLSRAEDIARERGCHGVHLDTFGFQAPGFYERLGYEAFGELPHYPNEEDTHVFFKKSLT